MKFCKILKALFCKAKAKEEVVEGTASLNDMSSCYDEQLLKEATAFDGGKVLFRKYDSLSFPTVRKPIKAVEPYRAEFHRRGTSLDDFLKDAREYMLFSLADLVGDREFGGKFVVRKLSDIEVWDEAESYRRQDGQYVVSGQFYTRHDVENLIREFSRRVVLDAYVIEPAV